MKAKLFLSTACPHCTSLKGEVGLKVPDEAGIYRDVEGFRNLDVFVLPTPEQIGTDESAPHALAEADLHDVFRTPTLVLEQGQKVDDLFDQKKLLLKRKEES